MGTFKVKVAAKTAEILLYDSIGENLFGGGISAERFIRELKAVGNVDRIVLRVNSDGGNVFDGVAMHAALERHPARIEAEVDALAASAASFIIMAADTIRIASNAWVMIHEGEAGVVGRKADFERIAALLDGVNENLVNTYSERTGLPKKRLRDMMTEETWLNAAQSVENGFADEVTSEIEVMARFAPDRFRNVPREVVDRIRASSVRPEADARRAMAREHAQRAALRAVA